jgi:hypothetical protein
MPDVDVPVAGKVDKRVLIGVGVAAGGYVAYRYYRARNTPAAASPDGSFEDPGVLPGVAGAVKDGNQYGSGNSTQTSDTSAVTTNAAWSQLALAQLSQTDRWSYGEIAEALGNYLGGQPLSDAQQSIVRAAVAVAGYPPVGSPAIIPGGNTTISVAPTGVAVSGMTPSTALVNFVPVPGARTYNVYRSGAASASGSSSSSPITLSDLTPNTTYSVTVAAVSASGAVGPKSSPVTFKTAAASLAVPATPKVSSVVGSRATLTTSKVPYATSYRWFMIGGQGTTLLNTTDGPAVTLTNLKPKSLYVIGVQADTSTGNPTKMSGTTRFKTK